MVTDGNQTNCGDHFVTYRNTESLSPGTNIVLQVNYINTLRNKQTHRKRDQICGNQGQEVRGGGIGGRQSKSYKIPAIRQLSPRDTMYHMIN